LFTSHLGTLAAFVALGLASPDARAGGSSVSELVREAREHEAANEGDIAIRRYTEALALDPTCGPAYLGLAALRAQVGDLREAERVYSMAIEHAPDLRVALAARARVRRALGALRDADMDLDRYASDEEDLGALRELAGWYAAEGRTSAELASWRRLYAAVLQLGNNAALLREARATVRALQILVGLADPVVAPETRDSTRRGIAQIARRGG
jgi:tetratricopeptide (TPR) repeat protein